MITSEMINAAFVNAMDKLGVAGSQGLRFSVYDSLDILHMTASALSVDCSKSMIWISMMLMRIFYMFLKKIHKRKLRNIQENGSGI